MDQTKSIELRELVMALETDGSIMLISKGKKRYYCPRIQFTGSQIEVVDYVKKILDRFVKTYAKIHQNPNALGKRSLNHVWAEGNKNLEPLLKILQNKMISSKRNKQVELLLEWIELRRDWRKKSYSLRCNEIIKEVSKLNKGETKIE